MVTMKIFMFIETTIGLLIKNFDWKQVLFQTLEKALIHSGHVKIYLEDIPYTLVEI